MNKKTIVTISVSVAVFAVVIIGVIMFNNGKDKNNDAKETTIATIITTTATMTTAEPQAESTEETSDLGYVNVGNGDNYAYDIFTDPAIENETDKNGKPVENAIIDGNKGKDNAGKDNTGNNVIKNPSLNNNNNGKKPNKDDNKNHDGNDANSDDGWSDFY